MRSCAGSTSTTAGRSSSAATWSASICSVGFSDSALPGCLYSYSAAQGAPWASDYIWSCRRALFDQTLPLHRHRVALILPVGTRMFLLLPPARHFHSGPLLQGSMGLCGAFKVISLVLVSGSSLSLSSSWAGRTGASRGVPSRSRAVRGVEAMRGRGRDIRGRRGCIELPLFSLFQHAEPGRGGAPSAPRIGSPAADPARRPRAHRPAGVSSFRLTLTLVPRLFRA
ncbi:hypothetical protein B0H16DRAFT_240134 [Mycena metata]|uniref:Uncharacterized protein n=1 Tax=Mycena metata TaxID=1033252 RepID=A0AAD7HUN9_9AGAR|nr:hypothetical protein B0H16DRAFT_240134 [Mycena metata]